MDKNTFLFLMRMFLFGMGVLYAWKGVKTSSDGKSTLLALIYMGAGWLSFLIK